MPIYLYVKTHLCTGLKYLGQTKYNPFTYSGSGRYWKRHIKKHGNDVHTEVLGIFDNQNDLRVAGEFYSHIWNVVESIEWANLCIETGVGVIGYYPSIEVKTRISQTLKSLHTDPNYKSNAIRNLLSGSESLANKTTMCPHCHKIGQLRAFKRWHFDKCKISTQL